jgi:hypothetical protein
MFSTSTNVCLLVGRRFAAWNLELWLSRDGCCQTSSFGVVRCSASFVSSCAVSKVKTDLERLDSYVSDSLVTEFIMTFIGKWLVCMPTQDTVYSRQIARYLETYIPITGIAIYTGVNDYYQPLREILHPLYAFLRLFTTHYKSPFAKQQHKSAIVLVWF